LKKLRDPDAELAVIGNALFGYIADLDTSDFTVSEYRDIWREIKKKEAAGDPIDLVSMPTQYAPTLTKAGIAGTITASEYYSERLRDLRNRRTIIKAMEATAKEVLDVDEHETKSALGRLYSRTSDISAAGGGASRVSVDRVLESYLDAIADPKDVWGIATGLPQ
jgi:replicative DNA helicase